MARAEGAVESVQADPRTAIAVAEEILTASTTSAEARAVARWALGLALREQGLHAESRAQFERAIVTAEEAGLAARCAAVRVSLALTLANLGDVDAALGEIARARPDVSVVDRARLDQQEALIRQRQGDLGVARTLYGRALRAAVDGGDVLLECRILSNLGVLEGYAGNVDGGVEHLTSAMNRAAALGQSLLEARAAHNLGFLEGQRGDVPAGLRRLDEAGDLYWTIGGVENDLAVLEADRATLMLDAGLHRDAVVHAAAALERIRGLTDSVDVAELTLLHARALRADGQPARAVEVARDASDRFSRQHRQSWHWVAEIFAFDCMRRMGGARPGWREVALAADSLREFGCRLESRRAVMLAARLAVDDGDVAAAKAQLGSLPEPRRFASAADRAALWQSTAAVRVATGDRPGARRALRAGLRAVDQYQSRFGSFELRARSVEAGANMSELGLRMAMEDGRTSEMLEWLESRRASALLRPPALAPRDRSRREALAELRMIEAQDEEASRRGQPADPVGAARRHELEEVVRSTAHNLSGDSGLVRDGRAELKRLPGLLGDRVLVAFFRLDGDLHALVQHRGRTRHHHLGPLAPIAAEIEHLAFAIARLGRRGASAASASAALDVMNTAAGVLDDALLAPIDADDEDHDLVVVPTGPLHGLPWRALRRGRERHAVAAPSARVWLAAEEVRPSGPGPGAVLLVAGPDLPGARSEVDGIEPMYTNPVVLVEDEATVSSVERALCAADTAHIAAHGRFRADNPLFSSLRLADGAFYAYELESVDRLPSMFVLPACQAASTTVHAGDELLGFSTALLALGARTVVAPLHAVSDHATRALMIGFHAALAEGHRPARALRRAVDETADESPAAQAAGASFTLIGAG